MPKAYQSNLTEELSTPKTKIKIYQLHNLHPKEGFITYMFFMMFVYDQISQQIDLCILLIYLNDVYIQHTDKVEQYIVLD
jgi:hypothetical protein